MIYMRIFVLTYHSLLHYLAIILCSLCLTICVYGQAKLLNPDGNAWQNSGYTWPCNMEPNENNGIYNEAYLKARLGYLCDDDFGGKNLVNLIRLEKDEGKAFVDRVPQEYFRRTCLSVSYDKDWVTWPDDGGETRNGIPDVNGIVTNAQYPAVVYAYSVPNTDHPDCYDVYYYVSDDSNPVVTGTCAKLFKTGFDSEQTCNGQKINYTSSYEDLSGIAYWDFENVSNLDQMFANCTKILEIDLNGVFSNSSGVSTMFKKCTSLESVSITGITKKFTSFASMFANLLNLKDVSISGDFSGVTTAASMFSGCKSLTDVQLDGNFNALQYANHMFNGCQNLPSITLSGNFSNVTTTERMFSNCYKLNDVIMPSNLTRVTNAAYMFNFCYALESIPSNYTFSEKLNNVKFMFNQCHSLPSVSISGSFENVITSEYMFNLCKKITSISIPTNLTNDTTAASMFSSCDLLETIPDAITFSDKLKRVNAMFASSVKLSSVNIEGSFENVITTESMFNNCPELETVTMPGNLSSNTTVKNMFQNCQKLETITNDLTFSSALTTMEYMFSNCKALTELTLKGTFSGVTTTSNMFNSAYNLNPNSISIGGPSGADFTSLENIFEMFQKWPDADDEYEAFMKIISQMIIDIDKIPGGETKPYRVTSSNVSGRWKGGVDGDTVVTANGLVYRMKNGYMTYWHILPIDLWKFDVSQDNDNLLFFWKTACETNNECFILEYSLDGSSYSTIARVAGAGNSSRINSYSAVWESVPYTGMLYFRLKQCDFSGHITYSNVLVYNMTCNPCKNDSLPKIYYGKSQYRIYNKKLIFCKGDNERE